MVARFGVFSFDSERRQLTRERDEIHLTPKAFDLLTLLIAEAPRVVPKAELHERLWAGTFVSDATLVGLVKELRRALGDRKASAPIVRTSHGVGYAFAAPLERPASARFEVSRWIVAGDRRIVLQEGDNLIGRDPAAAIFLDAAGVSRRHARIVVDEEGALLEDLGSRNGTRVGMELLTRPVRLRDGDRVQVGPILVIFRASAGGLTTEIIPVPVPADPTKT
jgi:DNA-binding winged helix-turn-helix (wHTH) protein